MAGIRIILLSLYCVAVATATSNGVTQKEIIGDIIDTICSVDLITKVWRYFDFCAEENVSTNECSKFLAVYTKSMLPR